MSIPFDICWLLNFFDKKICDIIIKLFWFYVFLFDISFVCCHPWFLPTFQNVISYYIENYIILNHPPLGKIDFNLSKACDYSYYSYNNWCPYVQTDVRQPTLWLHVLNLNIITLNGNGFGPFMDKGITPYSYFMACFCKNDQKN